MRLDRRRLLASSAWLASLPLTRASARGPVAAPSRLERVLEAHAEALPERPGAGASHYPMAAEALEALRLPEAIPETFVRGAAGYAGAPGRVATLHPHEDPGPALGDYGRLGDWLDLFRAELGEGDWRPVVARWSTRLAPGLCAGAFHGLIRTAHAVRGLGARDSAPRRGELAHGLAYWAARYAELPTGPPAPRGRDVRTSLRELEHPWLEDGEDVGFFDVVPRLVERPLAPGVELAGDRFDAGSELAELVREATAGFLEMLVQERHRIWVLHTVTGPAAVGLLLPVVDETGSRALVAHARQAVLATFAAFAAPYEPRAHIRPDPPEWPELVERAARSGSVHTIKLIEALVRFASTDDVLFRSTAVQFLEWT